MKALTFIGLFILFLVIIRSSSFLVHRYATKNKISPYRVTYISKTINIVLGIFFIIIMVNLSGVEYSQVSIFLSSMFAVLGVALFAQWSILSNITASLIIFFGFPYRVGDSIKIMDKDDDIRGTIIEISLFHVLIKRGDELITYPNNLILQKGVIKNPAANKSEITDSQTKEQAKKSTTTNTEEKSAGASEKITKKTTH